MHFKKGDLAIIVDGPWHEAIGRVVRIIWKCRTYRRRFVDADGQGYMMTADGPVYMVRPVTPSGLPTGPKPGEVMRYVKRRPYCGCHMRPLLRTDMEALEGEGSELRKEADAAVELVQRV